MYGDSSKIVNCNGCHTWGWYSVSMHP